MNWFGKLSMKRLWKWVPLATIMVSPLVPFAGFSEVQAATHISSHQKAITRFQPAVGKLTQSGKNDATFFKRASESMYISAQTANPLSGSSASGSSLNDVLPGQTIYLYTWEDGNTSSLQKSRWYVNSDSAMISQDTRHVWSLSVSRIFRSH